MRISKIQKNPVCTLPRPVIISGIGTGGHYFPALVIAQELKRRGVELIFLVRAGKKEEEIARLYDLPVFAIHARGFFGTTIFNRFKAILEIFYSVCRLSKLTKHSIGFACGGFGSIPLLVACFISRSQFYLFEPNRLPGRATWYFSAKAKAVFTGLPMKKPITGRIFCSGIPIREEFKNMRLQPAKNRPSTKTILFFGGSGGAQKINELALELQSLLPNKYKIVVISGKRDYVWMEKHRNGRTRVIPFTLSPWKEIRDADVIISRSGALAGYEIIISNKPVLFIPFPYAIDDHQYYNAEYFAKVGNAVVLREKMATVENVVSNIDMLLTRRFKKSDIVLNAERKIVDVIMKDYGL